MRQLWCTLAATFLLDISVYDRAPLSTVKTNDSKLPAPCWRKS